MIQNHKKQLYIWKSIKAFLELLSALIATILHSYFPPKYKKNIRSKHGS